MGQYLHLFSLKYVFITSKFKRKKQRYNYVVVSFYI
jgi:hypothetical protein